MSEQKAPKVLIADDMSADAARIMQESGFEVDVNTGLSPEALEGIIGNYDGLAVRSATKVTPAVMAKASSLKIVGRAGVGVDNIDVAEATEKRSK